jgi:hypothetical protein
VLENWLRTLSRVSARDAAIRISLQPIHFQDLQRDIEGFSLSSVAAEDWNTCGHAEGRAHHHYSGDILPHSVRHVLYIPVQLREEANSRSQNYTGQCHELYGCAETGSRSHDHKRRYVTEINLQSRIREV